MDAYVGQATVGPTKSEMDSAFAALNDVSPEEVNAQVLDVIATDALVDGKSLVASQQYVAAALVGKFTDAGTGTEKAYGLDGVTERVRYTVDASGNRTAVSYDP